MNVSDIALAIDARIGRASLTMNMAWRLRYAYDDGTGW
jgi:hypothetical protein